MADGEDDAFDVDAFEEEIKTWAEGVSQEARSAFASQCAARVLPNIVGIQRPKRYGGLSFDLTLLRAILISAVAGTRLTEDVKNAALSAYSASPAASPAVYSASFASSAAHFAAHSAHPASSASSAAYFAAHFAAHFAASSVAFFTNSAHSAADLAAELLSTASPEELFEQPLWMEEAWPDEIAANWATLRSEWVSDPAMAFWIDWYEGLLKGRRPDWDLWYEVVLIKDEHWEAGPEAVALEIDILQSAHSLEANIARLEEELLLLAQSPLESGNRHNGGPELEEPAERLAAIKLIQEQLAILRAEVDRAKPDVDGEPDPEKVENAIVKIIALAKNFLNVCLLAGKIAGGAAVGAVGVDVAAHYQVSEKVIELSEDVYSAGRHFIESLSKRPPAKKTQSSSSMDTPPVDI